MTDTYRLGLYEKSMPNRLTLREKLAVTKQAGFDYMELSVDESDEKLARLDWTPGEVKQLAGAVYELGVPIHSICLSGHRRFPMGHPDEEIRRQSMEIMEKAVILASRLSVRLIQLAGYDVYYEPGDENTRRWFESNLERAVLMAAKYGVTLAFETMETPFMNTVGKAMREVAYINNPWLQIYPDIGNLTCAAKAQDGSVEADMKLGYGHLSAVHLKETRPGEFREVPYGCGHVDFTGCACAAMRLGVRAFVGEFWYTGGAAWQSDISNANVFLRKKLDEAAKRCNT